MPNVKKRIKLEKNRSGIKAKFVPRPKEAPEVIEARWEKKKDRIHELANNVSRLRLNVTKDLESDNERTALIALIVALMDRTGERIGNGKSIKDGHYGVTYFKKSHATIRNNEVDLDYIGKSGVPHNPIFSSDKISKALKKAIKNSPSKYIFETSDGLKIHEYMVNDYLRDFSITGKDLRGYFINRAMTEKLKSIEIPETEKDRKKLFTKTCKQIASKIGHGAGTCKKHYIVPELMEQYIVHGKIIDLKSQNYYKAGGKIKEPHSPFESRMPKTNPHKEINNNTDIRYANGGIPDRYKNMGFSKVGQKKKSTRPQKKWMVLAKKGDKYKVVHGGQKGMEDFSQHRDKNRQKRFWNRMGGFDSEKASDPFSPLYWHKRFGTWEKGGVLEDGAIKVAWIDAKEPETLESKMFDNIDDALKYAEGKTFLIMELEDQDDDYYKWNLLPYGEHKRYKGIVNWMNIFEEGGIVENDDFANLEKSPIFTLNKITREDVNKAITGSLPVTNGTAIQAASGYLRRGEEAISSDRSRNIRGQDEERLREYISKNNLWLPPPPENYKFGYGGEASIYFYEDHVIKSNDAHFYDSWEGYFNSLLIHNLLFPQTSYELIGFYEYKDFDERTLYALVKQPYIKTEDTTNLLDVRKFMSDIGFVYSGGNHFYNPELGIELKDLHKGNVVTKNNVLFFIDTIFYVKDPEKKLNNGGTISDSNYFTNSNKISNFTKNTTKDEIQDVLSGKSKVVNGEHIKTGSDYIREGQSTSTSPSDEKYLKKQIKDYRKEGIFIKPTDNPVVGSLPISRFNGPNADILPSQEYVYRRGVAKWKIKIREGERPHVLMNIDQKGTPRVKDGHHRLKAYEELGFTEVPVIDVDGKVLNSKVSIIKQREILAHGGIIKYREAQAKIKKDNTIKQYLAGGEVPMKETIDDTEYRFIKEMKDITLKKQYFLEEIIKHDKLFEKHPQLRKFIIIFEDLTDEWNANSEGRLENNKITHVIIRLHFSFYKTYGYEKFKLKSNRPEFSKESTLLHELQHVLQFNIRAQNGFGYDQGVSTSLAEDFGSAIERAISEEDKLIAENDAAIVYYSQPIELEANWVVDTWLKKINISYGDRRPLFFDNPSILKALKDGTYSHKEALKLLANANLINFISTRNVG